ncbi:hypothetical protein [Rhizobium ruizarguesonis]|uniref:hypothetical protein n=1 Tax=Rhizobium ruizarguesonis TaxID=2081791 RepID=UPI0038572A2D
MADISAWGWLDRASRVLKVAEDPLAAYPNVKRPLMRAPLSFAPGRPEGIIRLSASTTRRPSAHSFHRTIRRRHDNGRLNSGDEDVRETAVGPNRTSFPEPLDHRFTLWA